MLAGAAMAGLGVAAPVTAAKALIVTAPRISSFSPRIGAAGTTVTITGTGFARVRAVRFSGVRAGFTVQSASKLTAVVPAMPSAAGLVTVTTRAGTARSRARFAVTPAVRLSPVTGPPGSAVTVSGTGFGARERADVFFGRADRAAAGTGRAGSFGPITITIPAAALPGRHRISAKGRHSGLLARAGFTVNTNWAQFRYSGAHTGTNPYENVLSVADVARIGKDWRFPTPNGVVYSSPAVSGGVVYIGSENGHVYALNAATGAKRWSFRAAGVIYSSPAVADGTVYIGSDDANVYALNAATGAERWTFTTGSTVMSNPAVADGTVYASSLDHNVYALNAATGARLWTFSTGGAIQSSPAVANGVVYIGSGDDNVYALNAATGAEQWSFTTGSAAFPSPAVARGMVYAGSFDGNVYALNAATGARRWTFATGGTVESSAAVANGMVYVANTNGDVYALNAATGARRWTFRTPAPLPGGSSPAVANGVVYIGSTDDKVYALNAATGARLWSFTTGGAVFSSPAVANGMVYVGSDDHNLYAFGLARRHQLTSSRQAVSRHLDVLEVTQGRYSIGSE